MGGWYIGGGSIWEGEEHWGGREGNIGSGSIGRGVVAVGGEHCIGGR